MAEEQAAIMGTRPVLIDAYDHEIERPRGSGTPEPERRNGAAVVPEQKAADAFMVAMKRTTTNTAVMPRRRAAAAAPKSGGRTPFSASASSSASVSSKRPTPAPVAEPDGLTPIQSVKRPKTTVDHTYRDFSRIPVEFGVGVKVDSESFTAKLHEVLTDADSYGEYIAWRPHGRAFAILKPKQMESKVLGKFFGHGRYSTFLRQLNVVGFKQITQGPDRNCFYHEAFLRGLPHLVRYMPPPKANRRRQAADPDNEPNLFLISDLFPLPVATSAVANAGLPLGGEDGKLPAEIHSRSARERECAELCMARASAAASLAAADFGDPISATSQAQALAAQRAIAAAATAEALRREREATAAAVSIVAARRRQHQLNLARSILLGQSAVNVGVPGAVSAGLGPSLGVFASPPTASDVEAAVAAALNSAAAGPPSLAPAVSSGAAGAADIDAGALMAAMASNTAATSGVVGDSLSLAGLPAATALQLQLQQQQQQHAPGGAGSALYRRFP